MSNLRELDTPALSRLRDMLVKSLAATRPHYSGLIVSALRRLINGQSTPEAFDGAFADQSQQNGTWGVHQMRVRLPGDPTVYRVIVAPATAPIAVNGIPIDQHFNIPLDRAIALAEDGSR